jgi:hypothetical protein
MSMNHVAFPLAPTNAQLDHSVIEYEHLHLGFLDASRGKQQTGPVPTQFHQEDTGNQWIVSMC